MVIIELAAGKGALAAGAGIIKLAAASGSGAVATALGPPPQGLPSIDAASPVLDGLQGLKTLGLSSLKTNLYGSVDPSAASCATSWAHGAVSIPLHFDPTLSLNDVLHNCAGITTVLQTAATTANTASSGFTRALALQGATIMSACVGAVEVLRRYGGFFDDDEDEDQNEVGSVKGLRLSIPIALKGATALDLYMGSVVLASLGQPLTTPLRLWALGGIVLSYPASCLVRRVVQKEGFRVGVLAEIGLGALAFLWLCYGTQLLSYHPGTMLEAPLLWWTCFAQCVLTWSVLTSACVFTILMTVISILFTSS